MNGNSERRLRMITGHLLGALEGPLASPNHCCGIIAVVGNDPVVGPLLEGLKILEARGYDSAGITTIDKGHQLLTTKFASVGATNNAINILEKNSTIHGTNSIGIAHTRWATHGGVTDSNAHPHLDCDNRIAVVHNGVIENFSELKKWLHKEHNIEFKSETDTEVIAQLVGLNVRQGMPFREAVSSALDRLRGTWGLVILDKENPDQIIVAKNGSPMLIGIGQDKNFVASEPAAFARYTKEYIALEDNEIAVITAKTHSLDRSRIEIAQHQNEQLSPDPWPHWTIKEIMEQPEALSRALNYGGRLLGEDGAKLGGLERYKGELSKVKHLVISGCGTSYFAGLAGAHIMRSLQVFDTVQVVDSAEMDESYIHSPNTALIVISQSGETKDVHSSLVVGQSRGIPCISVVNAVGSLIARSTDCGVYLNAGRENAVASTKAFTCQVTVLALVSLWFAQVKNTDAHKRKALVEALHRLPTNVGMSLRSNMRNQIKAIAKRLVDNNAQHIFILGKGASLPIALEGSLKIKEISYIHTEGFPGGALKHGPFALINKGTPIIFIILNDQHFHKMKTAVEETQARGAYCITITNIPHIYASYDRDMGDVISINSNGPLTSLLAVMPLQLLAYELSVLKNINPDRPRHLAKTVTVD
uniref:Glutamine--fructose-6-phosphate aminotransferase [isomerizing] n=1 Tax=Arcella intermedia TaxID=1963864 RepID=A0A6B2KZM4_9EUKA|eukprot:TRINITY_DN8521_c0_g1_i1.p1 TRINITY_DN8521_c0_g1~~TRINITY_DN8521_c0_g1_i1.p1  ORF type:complete len:654 (-),score=127.22 TRINITY_DN8521_c0_g1_i1:15-1952(-)